MSGFPAAPARFAPLATVSTVPISPPFPTTTVAQPNESWFADWRKRLQRNLARPSVGRWDPLTWTHG